jgi:hypothetical protein
MANEIVVYTDPLKPGTAQLPVFTVGDDQNWTLLFSRDGSLYDPGAVYVRIGFLGGLLDGTYASAFEFIDRGNNRHIGSFAVASAVPGSLTFDEDPIGVFGGDGAWRLQGRIPSGAVRKVYVINGGGGRSDVPRLVFKGGAPTATGQRASGAVALSGGTVTSATVTDSGSDYSVAPRVRVVGGGGAGAILRANLTNGKVETITDIAAGSGYSGAGLEVEDPEASAVATVSGTAAISSVALVSSGSGYTSAPTVAFTGGGGADAAATATLASSAWQLKNLALTGGGTGYLTTPTVTFTGGGGSGAAATANIRPADSVAAGTINSRGQYVCPDLHIAISSFYGDAVLSGGGGSGARLAGEFRRIGATNVFELLWIGTYNSGSGYATAPTVTGFTNFSISETVTQSVLADVTVALHVGDVFSIALTNPGTGYTSAPTVGFTGGSGTGATATVGLVGSPVASVAITDAGTGYTSPPTVSFSGGGGTGASATASLAGTLGITAVTVDRSGFAYTETPELCVIGGCSSQFQVAGPFANVVPYVRGFNPADAQRAITLTPFAPGRRDSSGSLVYDDGILVIRPRVLLSPAFTLAGDGLTYAAVFDPVVQFVQALLNFHRSAIVDIEIFGDGRLLHQGKLTILKRIAS